MTPQKKCGECPLPIIRTDWGDDGHGNCGEVGYCARGHATVIEPEPPTRTPQDTKARSMTQHEDTVRTTGKLLEAIRETILDVPDKHLEDHGPTCQDCWDKHYAKPLYSLISSEFDRVRRETSAALKEIVVADIMAGRNIDRIIYDIDSILEKDKQG